MNSGSVKSPVSIRVALGLALAGLLAENGAAAWRRTMQREGMQLTLPLDVTVTSLSAVTQGDQRGNVPEPTE